MFVFCVKNVLKSPLILLKGVSKKLKIVILQPKFGWFGGKNLDPCKGRNTTFWQWNRILNMFYFWETLIRNHSTKKLQISKCPWKYHIYFYFFFSPIIPEALLNRAHLNQFIFLTFRKSSAHRKVPNYSISIFLKIIFYVYPYKFFALKLLCFCVL